jgi:TonB family protein
MGLGAAGKGGQGSIGGSRGSRTQFGWYAAPLQNLIQGILSRNGLTNKAKFENVVRIWVDGSGRVTRVKLNGTTGDTSVDQAIVETLNKLQLTQSPPAEMPMPIVMRLSARRPN